VRGLIAALAMAALLVCATGAVANATDEVPLTLVKDGFSDPVSVTNAGDSRLFVVEQAGLIKIVHSDGTVTTFIDVSSTLLNDEQRGLFSLAFPPNYATNGLFYVEYTRAGDGATTVAEYRVSANDPDVADPNSGRVVIAVTHAGICHNGGWIGFHGKLLYITVGDGCTGGATAQDPESLEGKILRIDPRDPDGAGPRSYSVPAANPFVRGPGRDEIWSTGVRNTWRCSFDSLTGLLWCGDVGQNSYEEVDRVKVAHRHYNFGWNGVEGLHQANSEQPGPYCTADCHHLPIVEYSHASNAPSCSSITGGYVSRRPGASMYGTYVYGDFCSGRIWEIPANQQRTRADPVPIADTTLNISSFGQGADGRLYLVDRTGGAFHLLANS
jgi:glucose/arabinose dehydrogenase